MAVIAAGSVQLHVSTLVRWLVDWLVGWLVQSLHSTLTHLFMFAEPHLPLRVSTLSHCWLVCTRCADTASSLGSCITCTLALLHAVTQVLPSCVDPRYLRSTLLHLDIREGTALRDAHKGWMLDQMMGFGVQRVNHRVRPES
jgi:hypothetical protein